MASRSRGSFERDPFLIWVSRFTNWPFHARFALNLALVGLYNVLALATRPSPLVWLLAVIPVVVAAFYLSLPGLLVSWSVTLLAAGLTWWRNPAQGTTFRDLLLVFGLVLAFGVGADALGRFNRHLRELLESLELVQYASAAIAGLPNFRTRAQELLERVSLRLGATFAVVLLAERETGILRVEAAFHPPGGWIEAFDALQVAMQEIPLLSQVSRRQSPIVADCSPVDWWQRHSLSVPGVSRLFAVPVRGEDQMLGAIVLFHPQRTPFRSDETTLVVTVANHLAIALESAHRYEETLRQAVTDPLTGLYNRRFLDERLPEEWERAVRHQTALSLMILDLDHFKRVNDTHGHPAGDEVLRQLARIIEEETRSVDLRVRYGGEEFAVILPHTSAADAMILAERLRRAVQRHAFLVGDLQLLLTISIGVSSIGPFVASAGQLLQSADDALYMAKQRGRNRVCAAPPDIVGHTIRVGED